MKKRKWILVFFIYLILLFCLLFLPFVFRISPSLEKLRNYYTIVNSITSSLVGVTGIMLGVFYYFDKERRLKTGVLKSTIEEYNSCVKQILKLNVKDAKELKKLRMSIGELNDSICLMLDNGIRFLQLSDKKISQILRINSIVEKSEVVMRLPFKKLKRADRASVLDAYENVLRDALVVCYEELK